MVVKRSDTVVSANNGVDLPAMPTFTLNINQNPAITSSNIATFNELVMGSFVVMSTGNPTPALSEVGNLPNGVTFRDNGDGTAFLGGIPAAGSGGQYGFMITASNGVLPSATQTFTLTVVPRLSFTSPSSTTFKVGAEKLIRSNHCGDAGTHPHSPRDNPELANIYAERQRHRNLERGSARGIRGNLPIHLHRRQRNWRERGTALYSQRRSAIQGVSAGDHQRK